MGYIFGALRSLSDSDNLTFRLIVDGQAIDARGISCVIMNSSAVGGAVGNLIPHAVDPTDGSLDVLILNPEFDAVMSLVNGTFDADLSNYEYYWQGRTIEIDMDKPMTVTLDGEVVCDTPVKIEVAPQALRVLAPHT